MEETVAAPTAPAKPAALTGNEETIVSLGAQSGLEDTITPAEGADSGRRSLAASLGLDPSARLHHFLILDKLGAGGMGVVVSAYDSALDRKVAIKVLRPGAWGGGSVDTARARLQREAQAMAKLSHPNVVSVFDVRTLDDQVYIVMEFVDGQTVKDWMRAERRPWREVLDVFLQAGRGLAAAHRAGIVHRDFKPDNALLDKEGIVRVTDFGLAGVDADAVSESRERSGIEPVAPTAAPWASTMTRTGQLLGTPVYMAPEQHRGGTVDAKVDQFSFCVSLFEAVYGQRPFVEEDNYAKLAEAVKQGKRREPPKDVPLPAWVRRIIERGMSLDPDARYESMDDLLEDLESDPAVRTKRIAMGAGVIALAGIAIFAFARGGGTVEDKRCKAMDAPLTGVWDATVKTKMRKAFVASGARNAEPTFDRVAAILDDHTTAWVTMRTEACEATHLRGEQSGELLDRRMACLDRKLGETAALTALLAREADVEVVRNSVQAVYNLNTIAPCADSKALLAAVHPPESVAARRAVEAATEQYDDAEAQRKAGRFDVALERALALARTTKDIDYAPLNAQVHSLLGDLQSAKGQHKEAEATLIVASRDAARANDDDKLVRTWGQLAFVVGYEQARYAEAHIYLENALTLSKRSAGEMSRARVLTQRAVILKAEGRYEAAGRDYADAIRIYEKTADGDPDLAGVLYNYVGLLIARGSYVEARPLAEKMVALYLRLYGPNHANVADARGRFASVLLGLDEREAALDLFRGALEVQKAAWGPEHPRVAASMNGVGAALAALHRNDEARQMFIASHELWVRALGPDHPNVAFPLERLGGLETDNGNLPEALEYYRTALAIREKALGSAAIPVAGLRGRIGVVLLYSNSPDEALEELSTAYTITASHLPASDPELVALKVLVARASLARLDWTKAEKLCAEVQATLADNQSDVVADAMACRGEALLGAGRTTEAAELLEQAVARYEGTRALAINRARTRFALARAWRASGKRESAKRMARVASASLATATTFAETQERARIDSWLSQSN